MDELQQLTVITAEDQGASKISDVVEAINVVLRRNNLETPTTGEYNRPAFKKLLAGFLALELRATEGHQP